MKEYTIKYIDSYPGAGKTHWAINKMAAYLVSHITASIQHKDFNTKKFGQLIIYVAPTNLLITEIINSLKQRVYDAVYEKTMDTVRAQEYYNAAQSRIFSITLESISHKYASVNSVLRVGSKYCNAAAKSLHDDGYTTFSYEPDDDPRVFANENLYSSYLYTPGSVVFITQAAFWAANHSNDSAQKTFWNRASTRVIIDEARSCNCDVISIELSPDVYEFISTQIESAQDSIYRKIDRDFFYKDEVYLRLNRQLPSASRKALYDFLDRYESASFFIKYNIKHAKKAESSSVKATLVVMQVPYAALAGWKEIVLMSAFFKQSQLYAVLKCANSIEDINCKFSLKDITSSALDESRIEALKQRLHTATLTWVFDNYANISKKIYNSGIVVEEEEQNAETVFKDAVKDFNMKKSAEITAKAPIQYSASKNLKDFLFSSTNIKLKRDFINLHESVSTLPPVEYAITKSLEYAKQWLSKVNDSFKHTTSSFFYSQAKQLVLINFNKTLGYGFNLYNVWQSLPSDLRSRFTPLITDARGLNTYKQFSIIAVLSAFNLPPDIDAWFTQYCSETVVKDGKEVLHPWYDQYQDIALGQVVQTLMRCSLRDISLNNDILIILSTKKIAYSVNAIFDKAFKLKSPTELFKVPPSSLVHASLSYDELPDEIKQELNSKKAQAQAKYRTSNKFLETRYKSNIKELSDEDLLYKAYKLKNYNQSTLRKKYNSLTRTKSYFIKKLDDPNESSDAKLKYANRIEELKTGLARIASDSKCLLKQVRADFKKELLDKGQQALYNELSEYIDKVDKQRYKLAMHFKAKLEARNQNASAKESNE